MIPGNSQWVSLQQVGSHSMSRKVQAKLGSDGRVEGVMSTYYYGIEAADKREAYFAAKDSNGPSNLKINLKLEPLSLLKDIDISNAKVIEGTPAACLVRVKATRSDGKVIDKDIKLVKKGDRCLLDGAAW